MTQPQAATLNLLTQVERVLAEADRLRRLRDELLATARRADQTERTKAADRKAVRDAR